MSVCACICGVGSLSESESESCAQLCYLQLVTSETRSPGQDTYILSGLDTA